MKEEVKVVELDRPKQGMTLEAMVDFRNKQLRQGKCPALADEVIQDIFDAPVKRRKVRERGDAR